MAASGPARITCAKCGKEFVENRTVWPPNICEPCRFGTTNCSRKKTSRVMKTHRGSEGVALKKKVCNTLISGSQLDPTVPKGLVYCTYCRNDVCHSCGTELEVLTLERCRNCTGTYGFCRACAGERRGPHCVQPSRRVPPASRDPITYTPLSGSVTSCGSSSSTFPVYFGEKTTPQEGLTLTHSQAAQYAYSLFRGLVQFEILISGQRGDFELASSQNTLAIALLAADDHLRFILTYSDYNYTHVSTGLKDDHATFRQLVVVADPGVHYDKDSRSHYLYDRLAPRTNPSFKPSTTPAPFPWDGFNFIGKYPLHDLNHHHAEMRAYVFAMKRGYNILFLAPTKECCDKCRTSLSGLSLLERVPPPLRTAADVSRTNLPLDEDGGFLSIGSTTLAIAQVDGGGECLFRALLRSGLLPGGLPATFAGLRAETARLLTVAGSPAAARITPAGAAVDTQDLATICEVLGIRIVLYEAYYGFTRAHRATNHGTAGPIIPILIRSFWGSPDAHYDALVPAVPKTKTA